MTYAQFYHDSTGWNGKDYTGPVDLIEMCGSDGVYVLDGRNARITQKIDAENRARILNQSLNKGIKAYKIMEGRSFSDSKPVTGLIHISRDAAVDWNGDEEDQ